MHSTVVWPRLSPGTIGYRAESGQSAEAVKVGSAKSGANPGRFALNPVSQPKSITFFTERMTLKSGITSPWCPKHGHGIYKFEGNRLTIAFRKGENAAGEVRVETRHGCHAAGVETKPAARVSTKPD